VRSAISTLAPTLQAFFTDRLIQQRQVSPHTIAAYRDTLRLLLAFASARTQTAPSKLDLSQIDASLVVSFLKYLEQERHSSVRTRNACLAAIHSLFRYAALEHPEDAASIQRVLAIPPKKFDKTLVTFLTASEIDALLAAPDRKTWTGRRDHALLMLAVQTGLRISELIGLTCDVHLGTGAHVSCHGKGRKDRITPLTALTVTTLRAWTNQHSLEQMMPLFPTRQGDRLSRDAIEHRLSFYVAKAALQCTTLQHRKISAHVLRHTAAMQLLHAGVDTSVIALWLGHESVETTQIYLHADLALKEQAIARTKPPTCPPGRYKAPDDILAWLESL
jgi:integrase/recombinase XerD